MSYTVKNFKTKKELKEAVATWVEYRKNEGMWHRKNATYNAPEPVMCFNPGLGGDLSNFTGTVYLEGPHYPKPHSWYASGKMEDGILKGVK